jgi:hypothetical protein
MELEKNGKTTSRESYSLRCYPHRTSDHILNIGYNWICDLSTVRLIVSKSVNIIWLSTLDCWCWQIPYWKKCYYSKETHNLYHHIIHHKGIKLDHSREHDFSLAEVLCWFDLAILVRWIWRWKVFIRGIQGWILKYVMHRIETWTPASEVTVILQHLCLNMIEKKNNWYKSACI